MKQTPQLMILPKKISSAEIGLNFYSFMLFFIVFLCYCFLWWVQLVVFTLKNVFIEVSRWQSWTWPMSNGASLVLDLTPPLDGEISPSVVLCLYGFFRFLKVIGIKSLPFIQGKKKAQAFQEPLRTIYQISHPTYETDIKNRGRRISI